jgi:hypothetical protein
MQLPSVVFRLILYINHPPTPSLQRRGAHSRTPLLSEEGARGWRARVASKWLSGMPHQRFGSGVISETQVLQAAVIPAEAGIHSANPRKCAVHGLDSRFRGNDRRLVRDDIPDDTTTSD